MSRPTVIACMFSSSDSWELQQHPRLWHSRAGGGAVHSIKSRHCAVQQNATYSITSSTRTGNEGGILSPRAARLVKLSPKRFSSATGGAICGGWLIWEHTRFRGLGFRQIPVG